MKNQTPALQGWHRRAAAQMDSTDRSIVADAAEKIKEASIMSMARNRFNLTPDRKLCPTSYSIPADEVPAACAVLRSQGWQEIPRVGQLEYARFTGAGVTLILYVSGFVATVGLQAALAARGAS